MSITIKPAWAFDSARKDFADRITRLAALTVPGQRPLWLEGNAPPSLDAQPLLIRVECRIFLAGKPECGMGNGEGKWGLWAVPLPWI